MQRRSRSITRWLATGAVVAAVGLTASQRLYAKVVGGWYCPPTAAVPCAPGSCVAANGAPCGMTPGPANLYGNCVTVWYTWYCTTSYSCSGVTTAPAGLACSCSGSAINAAAC
jgi:hypothetical protein